MQTPPPPSKKKKKAPIALHSFWPGSRGAIRLLSIFRKISLSDGAPLIRLRGEGGELRICSRPRISSGVRDAASEDVFEVLHAVRLEKHQED